MKKMNPRKALAPLSLLLLSLSLLSCGKKAEKKETASQAPSVSEKTTEAGSTAVQKETATASAAQKETTAAKDTSQENAIYSAYLSFLEQKEKDILAYTWQRYGEDKDGAPISLETKGIAIQDVYGDSTPELLLMEGSHYEQDGKAIRADLHIYTYEKGKMVEIATKENLDYQVGGGALYKIFLTEKDKRLYLVQTDYDAENTENLFLLPSSGNLPLTFDLQASYTYDPEIGGEENGDKPAREDEKFTLYDKPIDKKSYFSFLNRIQERDPLYLITNYGESVEKDSIAMSYQDAVTYLKNKK